MPEIRKAGSVGVKADIDIESAQFRAAANLFKTAESSIRDYKAKKQNALDQGAISKFNNEQTVWDAALSERLKTANAKDHQAIIDEELALRDEAVAGMQDGLSERAKKLIADQWGTKSQIARIRAAGITERAQLEEAKNEQLAEISNTLMSGSPGSLESAMAGIDAMVESEQLGKLEASNMKAKMRADAASSFMQDFALSIKDPSTTIEQLDFIEEKIAANEVLDPIQEKELQVQINQRRKTANTESDQMASVGFKAQLLEVETSKEVEALAIPDGISSDKVKSQLEFEKKRKFNQLKVREIKDTKDLLVRVQIGEASEYDIDVSETIPDVADPNGIGITKDQAKRLLSKTGSGLPLNSDEYDSVKKEISKIVHDGGFTGDADLKDVKKAWDLIGLDEGKFDPQASRLLVQQAMLAESKLYSDGEIDVGGFWVDKEVTESMASVVDSFAKEMDRMLGGKGDIRYAQIAPEDAFDIWEKARVIFNQNADQDVDPKAFYKDQLEPILTSARQDSVWFKIYKL